MSGINKVGVIPSLLARAFQLLFVGCFGLILFNVVFNREVYAYFAPILILLALFVICLVFWIYSKLGYKNIDKHYIKILLAMSGGLFLVQVLFAVLLRFDPIFDLEAVYKGAVHWVETGTFVDYDSSTCHTDYFYIFPNNLGCLYFMYLLFKGASLLGIRDYFMVAAVCNSLMICGTMLLSSGVARRLWSKREGLLCAALFLLSPPFWFLAPVIYTDSLTLIFPVAVWYCVLRADECNNRIGMIGLYLLSAVLIVIGGLIKPTVWIAFIAIGIVQLLRKQWLRQAILTVTAIVMLVVVNFAFDSIISQKHLDPVKSEEMNLPYEYWLSIGLSQDGDYRDDYFQISMQPEGQQAKKDALRPLIQLDLKQQGVSGLFKLFTVKTTRAFGDGTYASSDFLDDRPVSPNLLHKFLLYDSEHYSVYTHIATGVLVALLALAVLGCIKSTGDLRQLVAPLCLFGLMLFLMVWEVNARYILNFVPMLFISATAGVKTFSKH